MNFEVIGFAEGERHLDWQGLCAAFEAGLRQPKAEVSDSFLYRGKDTLLSRAAWIDGMGLAVKSATVYPGNPRSGQPMINGAVCVFSDAHGGLDAVIDFHLVTKWKTAGDSLFAAKRLARPESQTILIVGAGTVGHALYDAYSSVFPNARFQIWNRTQANAEAMAEKLPGLELATNLEDAVRRSDIVTSATMTLQPLIQGAWLQPGQHIDLIGAYRPDMREADDEAIERASLFVDSRDTTIGHIGEIEIPRSTGVISEEDIRADYYELEKFKRSSSDEITLFKNGGGAHLDLMTSRYILNAWRSAKS
ncbi:MAG: ornithine cyclodeaminase [Pseudomonadota bacterium]